ncbi:hypothetical protein [Homoserinimonas hongtaonis]|uniref:hypothetical protein n=1 Tax=Homoserinimonas hongtaonis TaxID=2079791 RepID=UPI000D364C65|nr:hypothetical protein [Salinibacterium hongtaonis]AWB89596.1 hypothetical protein C2138_08610 [Salinibacterium hongtaonis]
MPRSNRPRNRRRPEVGERDLAAALFGGRQTESKRGIEWNVQPVAAPSALKGYTCPGCSGQVAAGTAHVVVWRADSFLGDERALSERRHWHSHCWKIA